MNQPSMTNEQFALWFAAGQGPSSKLLENADIILQWLNSKQSNSSNVKETTKKPK